MSDHDMELDFFQYIEKAWESYQLRARMLPSRLCECDTCLVTMDDDAKVVGGVIPMAGDDAAQVVAAFTTDLLQRGQVAVLIVNECWLLEYPLDRPGFQFGCMPSEHPERIETLMGVLTFRTGHTVVFKARITESRELGPVEMVCYELRGRMVSSFASTEIAEA
uniref:Uncharacterized protein n=1 Tax=viral metagenome TaxID=1070528 RepID=A0A6M3M3U6_9ZZZZ